MIVMPYMIAAITITALILLVVVRSGGVKKGDKHNESPLNTSAPSKAELDAERLRKQQQRDDELITVILPTIKND